MATHAIRGEPSLAQLEPAAREKPCLPATKLD